MLFMFKSDTSCILSMIFCFVFACSDSTIISKNITAPFPTEVNKIWNILKMLNYRLKHFIVIFE